MEMMLPTSSECFGRALVSHTTHMGPASVSFFKVQNGHDVAYLICFENIMSQCTVQSHINMFMQTHDDKYVVALVVLTPWTCSFLTE